MRFSKLWPPTLALAWGIGALYAQDKQAQDQPECLFGTTVVDTSGLQGRVFPLKPGTRSLPKFKHLRPAGSVYTTSLNVWPQEFDQGFPNITDRFEWFAIEYTGKIWIENAGRYRFSLLSDDGSKLYLDNFLVIANDGQHGANAISGGATLSRGVHEIQVDYFQGPRYTVALVLAVAPPGVPWRIFNMNEFKPPNDPDQLQAGEISDVRPTTK